VPQPVPRQEVVDSYWSLAAERQEIFFRRLEGSRSPWTSDPILRKYKFCNAYRASDRVSQYLIRDVIYGPGDYDDEDTLLRIILFRLFSKIETWRLLADAVGDVTRDSFDVDSFGSVFDKAFSERRTLYTSAFILCANRAFGHDRKHRNHLALIEFMFRPGGLPAKVAKARSLADVYDALAEYPLIGPFMAYQLAVDINYSELCQFSEDEFTVAGPGAQRGIKKCFVDTGGLSSAALIHWMTERQHEEFDRLGISFLTLYGRPLKAIDIQNLFCETDKYARVAFPTLVSNRSRIKAKYAPSGALPMPFYPPKWGLRVDPTHGGAEYEPAEQLALL
jgi:hypothetical protein